MPCVFCQIVNKEISAKIIYEDERFLALTPLQEVSLGHTLLIPKVHFENILDIDENQFLHFSKVLRTLAIDLVNNNHATGINILNASGKDAQQSVFHLHFHLVPRYPDDGLDMWIKQGL